MKERLSRKRIICVLAFCTMILTCAIGVYAVTQSISETDTDEWAIQAVPYKKEAVVNYINDEGGDTGEETHPTLENYIFGGWYTEEDCTRASIIRKVEDVPDTGAYAKFVREEVLSVKAQISGELLNDVVNDDDNYTPIRFLTSVDNLSYYEIGLKITYSFINSSGETINKEFNTTANKTVYKTLNAKHNGLNTTITPASAFCPASTYFKTHVITNIPWHLYTTEFTVTPHWVTADGTKVEGISRTLDVESGCIRDEVWVAYKDEATFTTANGKTAGYVDDRCYYGSQDYPYESLEYALETMSNRAKIRTAADGTTNDTVKIHIASDLTIPAEMDFANPNGINYILDGANGEDGRYTITTEVATNKNAFRILTDQTGSVTISNLNLVNQCQNNAIQIKSGGTINLTDLDIQSTTDNIDYQYALINILAEGTNKVTNLNLTDVTATIAAADTSRTKEAIIRTGNSETDQTVNIKLKGCTLDASGAPDRHALVIMGTTIATVTAIDTTFTTQNMYPIRDLSSGKSTVDKTRCPMSVKPIGDDDKATWADKVALDEKNQKTYTTIEDAVAAAIASTDEITIDLIQDVALPTPTTETDLGFIIEGSSADRKITIDGNQHTISAYWEDGNHSITIRDNKTTNMKFKNMTMEAHNKGSMIQVVQGVPDGFTLDLTDVILDATDPKVDVTDRTTYPDDEADYNYNYALIQIGNVSTAETAIQTTLNLTRFYADMDANVISRDQNRSGMAVVRTGNDTDHSKKVTINCTGSTFDTEGATLRRAIAIMKTTDAEIYLNRDESEKRNGEMDADTYIMTFDALPIKDGSGKAKIYENGYKYSVKEVEASIGETLYTKFTAAVTAANAYNETDAASVTIQLLKDITLMEEETIHNTSEKAVIIDGGNHTITAQDDGNDVEKNNTFTVEQTAAVTFQNITINHQNHGAAVKVVGAATVNLKDMIIEATAPKDTTYGYYYALINLLGDGTTSNPTIHLNMDTVDIDMDVPTTASARKDEYLSIIRTGNSGETETKTVNITMDNCNLDATDAIYRSGIVVRETTTANITLNDTTMKTQNAYVIKNMNEAENSVTLSSGDYTDENYKSVMKQGETNYVDMEDGAGVKEAYGTYVGTIDIVPYVETHKSLFADLAGGFSEAYGSAVSRTLELLRPITVTNTVTITKREDHVDQPIILDGNGFEMTLTGSDNSFAIGANKDDTIENQRYLVGEVTFQNMTIHKQSGEIIIQMYQPTIFNMNNVKIDTIGTSGNHKWCLINMLATGGTKDTYQVNLDTVEVDMDVSDTAEVEHEKAGIIRTGNEYDGDDKKVSITVKDSILDTTGAINRSGIVVTAKTTATVALENTTITTQNVVPIRERSGGADITADDECEFTSTGKVAGVEVTPTDKITYYDSFEAAANAAKANYQDTTIHLLQDVTVSSGYTFDGERVQVEVETTLDDTTENVDYNVGSIVINGWKNTLTTSTGTANSFVFSSTTRPSVEFKDMKMIAGGTKSLLQVTKASGDPFTLKLTDVEITTSATAQYAIINAYTGEVTTNLVLTNVKATITDDGDSATDSAFIRTGNNDTDVKTVKITLDGCEINTVGSAHRHAISIKNTTNAVVKLLNGTTITTASEGYAIYRESKDGVTVTTMINIADGCILTNGNSTALKDTVYGYTFETTEPEE